MVLVEIRQLVVEVKRTLDVFLHLKGSVREMLRQTDVDITALFEIPKILLALRLLIILDSTSCLDSSGIREQGNRDDTKDQ